MDRKPLYAISELAVVLGICKSTLIWRLDNSDEKPTPRGGDLLSRHFNVGESPSRTARTARYYRDEFIEWHKRNWIDSGRATACGSNSAGKGGEQP